MEEEKEKQFAESETRFNLTEFHVNRLKYSWVIVQKHWIMYYSQCWICLRHRIPPDSSWFGGWQLFGIPERGGKKKKVRYRSYPQKAILSCCTINFFDISHGLLCVQWRETYVWKFPIICMLVRDSFQRTKTVVSYILLMYTVCYKLYDSPNFSLRLIYFMCEQLAKITVLSYLQLWLRKLIKKKITE